MDADSAVRLIVCNSCYSTAYSTFLYSFNILTNVCKLSAGTSCCAIATSDADSTVRQMLFAHVRAIGPCYKQSCRVEQLDDIILYIHLNRLPVNSIGQPTLCKNMKMTMCSIQSTSVSSVKVMIGVIMRDWTKS